jgi:hypothetical protein
MQDANASSTCLSVVVVGETLLAFPDSHWLDWKGEPLPFSSSFTLCFALTCKRHTQGRAELRQSGAGREENTCLTAKTQQTALPHPSSLVS